MAVSRLTKTYERKDAVLALVGPIAVLAELVLWLALFGAAFVIMLVPYAHNFGRATSQVGAAMFTLGLARSASRTNDTIVTFAAASGFVVIALQIAYLPSLYAAFNRREALITMLVSRAGEPSWGPEILIRHQLVGIGDALPDFYASWEQWAAEFSESHSSYPVLLLFRSPDPWSSWVLALLSVLDAAAMQLALNPTTTPSQARLCLRMGYTALRRVSDALGWDFDPDPLPDGPLQLSAQEFGSAVALLRESGYEIERDSDAAWPHFRGCARELRRPCLPVGRPCARPSRALVRHAHSPASTGRHAGAATAPLTRQPAHLPSSRIPSRRLTVSAAPSSWLCKARAWSRHRNLTKRSAVRVGIGRSKLYDVGDLRQPIWVFVGDGASAASRLTERPTSKCRQASSGPAGDVSSSRDAAVSRRWSAESR